MTKPVTHARGVDGGSMCGRGTRLVAGFQEIGCKRCSRMIAAQNRAYVEQARALLSDRDVISAGQIAYRVHGARARVEHNEAADFALMAARDEFRRASMLGASRFAEVYLWRRS
jgi:hypothetical protein